MSERAKKVDAASRMSQGWVDWKIEQLESCMTSNDHERAACLVVVWFIFRAA